ncbi:MAG: HNH endonuclease [Deltaproteobacteria bacterium]|nr:HNH endonuclease [Deltaproteobacteria bacterium]
MQSLNPRIANIDTNIGTTVNTKRIRGKALMKIIQRIGERDGYKCQVCGKLCVDGEVDHKWPLHLGGTESDENRQWICREPCHRLKTEKEAKERG